MPLACDTGSHLRNTGCPGVKVNLFCPNIAISPFGTCLNLAQWSICIAWKLDYIVYITSLNLPFLLWTTRTSASAAGGGLFSGDVLVKRTWKEAP